jgi:hypothetical protein
MLELADIKNAHVFCMSIKTALGLRTQLNEIIIHTHTHTHTHTHIYIYIVCYLWLASVSTVTNTHHFCDNINYVKIAWGLAINMKHDLLIDL